MSPNPHKITLESMVKHQEWIIFYLWHDDNDICLCVKISLTWLVKSQSAEAPWELFSCVDHASQWLQRSSLYPLSTNGCSETIEWIHESSHFQTQCECTDTFHFDTYLSLYCSILRARAIGLDRWWLEKRVAYNMMYGENLRNDITKFNERTGNGLTASTLNPEG